MRRQPWQYASVISIMEDGKDAGYVERLLKHYRTEDDRPLSQLIYRCASDLGQCEEDLLLAAARIETDLEALKANLSVGNHINEMGILQREPVKLDMLAAKRQMIINQLKSLTWAQKEGS